MLDTVTYSEFRSHLADYVEMILEDNSPLRVKLKDGKNLLISLEKPKKSRKSTGKKAKMDETEYLLASPANAKLLIEALNSDPKKRISYTIEEFREKYNI